MDESDGCGAKFSLLVVAKKFEGMAVIDRQVGLAAPMLPLIQLRLFIPKHARGFDKKEATWAGKFSPVF